MALQVIDRPILRALTDDANPNGSLENIAGVCNEARPGAG